MNKTLTNVTMGISWDMVNGHGCGEEEEVNDLGQHIFCVHSTVLETLTRSLISEFCFQFHFFTDVPFKVSHISQNTLGMMFDRTLSLYDVQALPYFLKQNKFQIAN